MKTTKKLDQLVLIAPDVDISMFKEVLPRLAPVIDRITVYACRNCPEISTSQLIHNRRVLGDSSFGPPMLNGVDSIDLGPDSVFEGGDKRCLRSALTRDIFAVLKGTPIDQRFGLKRSEGSGWMLENP